jgi:hypothetical protein
VSERLLTIARHLKSDLGLTPEQAAGVLGNFKRETGQDLATDRNEGGAMGLPTGRGGYGLAQWTGSRQQDLVRFAGGAERAADLGVQLQFLSHELRGTERRALESLRQARSPEEAAVVFDRDFERSGVKALPERQQFARRAYEMLAQAPTGGAVLPPGSGAQPTMPGYEPMQFAGSNPAAIAAAATMGVNSLTAPSSLSPAGNPLVSAAMGVLGMPGEPMAMPRRSSGQSTLGGIAENAIQSILGQSPQFTQMASAGGSALAAGAPAGGGMSGGPMRVGRVSALGEDPLPSTGEHLDVRIQRPDGEYINPKTARSLLANLRIGGKPLYSQQNGDWVASFPVTSGFGPRTAPVAGASTFHRGVDYGVAAGTPLEWHGAPGRFSHQGGIGVLELNDGHRLKFLHTMPS